MASAPGPLGLGGSVRFTGLSSGTRLLIVLTIALLPLGLIALFASIRSAENNRRQHRQDANIIVAQAARQIDLIVTRDARALRAALIRPDEASVSCQEALAGMAGAVGDPAASFALYDARGRRRCTTDPSSARVLAPRTISGVEMILLRKPPGLRVVVADPDQNGGYATIELPLASITRAVAGLTRSHGASLIQGDTRVALDTADAVGPLDQRVTVGTPLGGGQLWLGMTVNIASISALEVLLVLLPMLMWLAGAAIGWLVVERLLLRPLAQLEQAVVSHRAGEGFAVPRLTTPAHEIRNLAEAFRVSAEEQAGHDAALEAGLARQTKLTREVHHRVKNNLQVVASLINLHARGTAGDVQRAYASIQRRVDALAVVHRNHYAEMEENRGINLRTLVAELSANLRGSAPPDVTVGIAIAMPPAAVNQDTAVPVAFLLTEVVELVMDCHPDGQVTVALEPGEDAGRMRLSIACRGLNEPGCLAHPGRERFLRIIQGLARQLRSPLVHDEAAGRFEIIIPILG